MSFEHRGNLPLDYGAVAYPGSVLRFRGPARAMDRPYVLCLGGSETFGRFIATPFPAQLDTALDCDVVNMGVMNAGLDVLMNDAAIQHAVQGANAVVLQITGAPNMTNRFYSVHPRRNDRFTRATRTLRTIYHEVDFTEFHFTRHLLTHLRALSADRFDILRTELQTAWRARIRAYLSRLSVPVHLLWLSTRGPDDSVGRSGLGADPLFVTGEMLEEIAPLASSLTVIAPTGRRRRGATRGMFFAPAEAAAARALPGPDLHDLAASQLRTQLS